MSEDAQTEAERIVRQLVTAVTEYENEHTLPGGASLRDVMRLEESLARLVRRAIDVDRERDWLTLAALRGALADLRSTADFKKTQE